MKKVKLEIEFEYDEDVMHGDDQDAINWFFSDILKNEKLNLHSNEIGDFIGTVKVNKVLEL